jgi:hypothetical protein
MAYTYICVYAFIICIQHAYICKQHAYIPGIMCESLQILSVHVLWLTLTICKLWLTLCVYALIYMYSTCIHTCESSQIDSLWQRTWTVSCKCRFKYMIMCAYTHTHKQTHTQTHTHTLTHTHTHTHTHRYGVRKFADEFQEFEALPPSAQYEVAVSKLGDSCTSACAEKGTSQSCVCVYMRVSDVYVYICVYVCVCVCIYIYIYIYIYQYL